MALALARAIPSAASRRSSFVRSASSTVGIVAPTGVGSGLVRRWPCFPEANPREAGEYLRQTLLPFREAGIDVHGVWLDDEGLPYPWNGAYFAQRLLEDILLEELEYSEPPRAQEVV